MTGSLREEVNKSNPENCGREERYDKGDGLIASSYIVNNVNAITDTSIH
jgi:hypothetical protein